ncbi:orotate phosphoribosyltransferase [Acuticoccus sp. M5D2P5]|uniref:orotate phosphoribosyltransferase n=1 Tax=Acuticoccus kalidii TaxID=2910977 RepID=UPI001F2B1882|nr:orotate phosphoribosyltransferase [Acuticoccus kalidii]MCF3934785.1 orotate phosphoribosyltransferase [Acuticoccus kalidii]
MLLEVDAIEVRPEQPFVFSSGWASPVYIDGRALISYPRLRRALVEFATATICRNIGFETLQAVAGGETAGIPYASWIAESLFLPLVYVRKKPLGFGNAAQIEGRLPMGNNILLVEDLTTDGRSKINFCNALRRAGAKVDHTFVMFFYDIFPGSRERLAAAGLNLHYLATWRDVLEAAKDGYGFDPGKLAEAEAFLNDPVGWSAAHGGISALPE